MADYSQIIEQINANIVPENNARLITGRKLNDVLRAMIAAVNATKNDNITGVQYLALVSGINAELVQKFNAYQNSIEYNAGRITTEVNRATNAEGALGTRIDGVASGLQGEAQRAAGAEEALGDRITTEVGAEKSRAELAESLLNGRIDTIIASSDLKDIVGTYADLMAYDKSTLGDNDIIEVLTDETHQNTTSFYRYIASSDSFTFVGSYAATYTKTEVDALLAALRSLVETKMKQVPLALEGNAIKDPEGNTLNYEAVKALVLDESNFVYLLDARILHIPAFINEPEEDGAIEFAASFIFGDRVAIHRVIINSANEVKTNQVNVEHESDKLATGTLVHRNITNADKYVSAKALGEYLSTYYGGENILKDNVQTLQNQVNRIFADFAEYDKADFPDVNFGTPTRNGAYIGANGQFVTDAGYNVSNDIEVTRGNLYKLYVGNETTIPTGIAVFSKKVMSMTPSGEKVSYVPQFVSAGGATPKSGYLVFLATEDMTIVTSYPTSATKLEAVRYGVLASLCTQIDVLRKAVDLKSFADGYYAQMRVGLADALSPMADGSDVYTEYMPSGRPLGDAASLTPSNATDKAFYPYAHNPEAMDLRSVMEVTKVEGDALGSQQMCSLPTRTFTDRGIEYTYFPFNVVRARGKRTTTGLSGIVTFGIIGGHKILLMRMWSIEKYGNEFRHYAQWSRNGLYGGDITANRDTLILSMDTQATEIRLQSYSSVVGTMDVDVSGPFVCLDLTNLFPTAPSFVDALGQQDAPKVLNRLGIFSFLTPIE